jgi:hypothetical protein
VNIIHYLNLDLDIGHITSELLRIKLKNVHPILIAMSTSGLGRLQDQSNRLRLLDNTMIMITITLILNVIDCILINHDYNHEYNVYHSNVNVILHSATCIIPI